VEIEAEEEAEAEEEEEKDEEDGAPSFAGPMEGREEDRQFRASLPRLLLLSELG
jgi:hypothetical protein